MNPLCRALALVSIPVSAAFVYFHVRYWTQPANCSPCSPEYFHYSIGTGVALLFINLVVWGFSGPETAWKDIGSRSRVHAGAWKILLALAASALACLVLIGLASLPVVALLAACFYIKELLSARAS